jgi:thiol-disulfide isomerase/thioredoxin
MRSPRSLGVVLVVIAALGAPSMVVRADEGPGAAAAAAGYMGVELHAAPGGVRVVTIAPNSPASSAGLQQGDVIVTARGGPIHSVEEFTLSVRAAGAGARYALVVLRGRQRVNLDVRLASAPRMGSVAVGSPAPSLNARLVMGAGPSDLAQLRGRVVLLDFWASWCGPCRVMMPVLNGFHQRYAAQGLTVLGVTDEGPMIARAVGTQLAIRYTLASEPSAAPRFGVTGLPTMVVIDRSGNVRRVVVGLDGSEMRRLDALVRQLLAEPAP